MALLPDSKDGTHWTITNIGKDVAIIENPGLDTEAVHWRYKGDSVKETEEVMYLVRTTEKLDDFQKFRCSFWIGYFYAHLASQLHGGF